MNGNPHQNTLSPFVYWGQTESVISLRVDLKNVKEPEIVMTEDSLRFSAHGVGASGANEYAFDMQFYGRTDPNRSFWKAIDRHVEFVIAKEKSGQWPRLMNGQMRPVWLRLDFDKMGGDSSDEEEDDPDAWRKAQQPNQNAFRDLGPYKDFGRGRKSAKRPEELRKTYLLLYNMFQFIGFFFVFIVLVIRYAKEGEDSIKGTYDTLGRVMKFLHVLQVLEIAHPLLGFTRGSPFMPALQLCGRLLMLFVMIGAEPRMQTKPAVFYLFLFYSMIEVIRYPYYMLHVFGVNVGFLTWLRYTAWIPLYPLGFITEGVIILRNIPYFEETENFSILLPNAMNFAFYFPTFLRLYLLIGFFPLLYMMMTHMYRQRVKVIGPRSWRKEAEKED